MLGFNVIHHQNLDFFSENMGEIIVSNPPFSILKKVLQRLSVLDKPFILILPTSKLHTLYFKELFGDKNMQILIPRKRINFNKIVDGKIPENYISRANFDCLYYCYKKNLEKDIIFLDH